MGHRHGRRTQIFGAEYELPQNFKSTRRYVSRHAEYDGGNPRAGFRLERASEGCVKNIPSGIHWLRGERPQPDGVFGERCGSDQTALLVVLSGG